MPLTVCLFALGVILLQQQAGLPLPAGHGPSALVAALCWAGCAWRLACARQQPGDSGHSGPSGETARLARSAQSCVPAQSTRPPQCWPLRLLALGLACLCGFLWAAWRAELRLADTLDPALAGRDIRVSGLIASLPQPIGQQGGWRFEFLPEASEFPLPERLALSWYQRQHPDSAGEPPRLVPGQRWTFTVRLKRPHGNANPGQFDYEAWLFERNIRATGHVRPPSPTLLDEHVWHAGLAIERWRDSIRQRVNRQLPAESYPHAGILLALAIGDQKAIASPLWAVFNRTGVTHLMSISGLHVTLVASLFGLLAGTLWRRVPALALRWPAQHAGLAVTALAACLYALLAGFAVPAQRTLYMLIAALAAQLLGRRPAAATVLAAALLIVLLLDPWAVLSAGFWLSFVAVAALLHAVAPAAAHPGWRGMLARWGATQWIATLASLPILLMLFQQFSLVSPLANAIAIPLVGALVTPLALLGCLLGWDLPLRLAHLFLPPLLGGLDWLAGWPLWQAAAAPLPVVLAGALGVAVCLLPRGLPGRPLGLLLLLPLLFWPARRPEPGAVDITVLDVGQGLATVVRTARHTLLYDPGPLYSAESDAGQRIVVPYLRWLGEDGVDHLIVTHRDSDHAGGLASVQGALPVGELSASYPLPGARPCHDGQHWTWDGVAFAILHPAPEANMGGRSNHRSCVLQVTAGSQRVLLTSDIEAEDEARLLREHGKQLESAILLVPHHGSRTSSTPDFLAAVAARHAVIPVGHRNRYGHPRPDVLARHADAGSQLWRTDQDGAIRIGIDPSGELSIHAERRERRRYWQDAPERPPGTR